MIVGVFKVNIIAAALIGRTGTGSTENDNIPYGLPYDGFKFFNYRTRCEIIKERNES